MKITVLVPAYNEASSIGATLAALGRQSRLADEVVVIPNGCIDSTAALARQYPVTVYELPRLAHKKSEALNRAWFEYCQDTDIVVCLDADTVLPYNALEDWEDEMIDLPALGGSSSKFTMLDKDFLTRLQKFEFARWTYTALKRGYTTVLAGTGCAIRNDALREVVAEESPAGPWPYDSQVEDFKLTHWMRQRGWLCHVSPTVRAYTDSMCTVPELWAQRMKWQVGTVEDLLALGLTRLTALDWWQQVAGLFAALTRLVWIAFTVALVALDHFNFTWYWWVFPPVLFIAGDLKAAFLIPFRDKRDILMAAALLPQELFAWMRAAWFATAWLAVISQKAFRTTRKDRWAAQHLAEGIA